MTSKLTGEFVVEDMDTAEQARATRVENILPALRDAAAAVDAAGDFHRPHKAALRDAGLLGVRLRKHRHARVDAQRPAVAQQGAAGYTWDPLNFEGVERETAAVTSEAMRRMYS